MSRLGKFSILFGCLTIILGCASPTEIENLELLFSGFPKSVINNKRNIPYLKIDSTYLEVECKVLDTSGTHSLIFYTKTYITKEDSIKVLRSYSTIFMQKNDSLPLIKIILFKK